MQINFSFILGIFSTNVLHLQKINNNKQNQFEVADSFMESLFANMLINLIVDNLNKHH